MAQTGISEREILQVLATVRANGEAANVPQAKLDAMLLKARSDLEGN